MSGQKVRFDSLSETLGFQLRRASGAIQSLLEAELEPLDLRTSEATIILGLGENPGCTQSELGRDLRIKSANLVPLVGRLVSAGLLERVPGKGRAVALHLTDDGARKLREVRAVLQRQEDRITDQLPALADKEKLLEALRAIATFACLKGRG